MTVPLPDVLELLKKHFIDSQTVQSSGPLFWRPRHKVIPGGFQDLGYTCYNDIHFVLSRVEVYLELIEAMADVRNVTIANTAFFYSRHEEVMKEAQLKALEDARTKATRMLTVYDLKLGPVLRITEGGSPLRHHDAPFLERSVVALAECSQTREGLVKITGSVNVEFAIESDKKAAALSETVLPLE